MVWQTNPIKIYLTITFFCPPRKMWPAVFAKMMKNKVEKKNNIELIIVSFIKTITAIIFDINSNKKHEINHIS